MLFRILQTVFACCIPIGFANTLAGLDYISSHHYWDVREQLCTQRTKCYQIEECADIQPIWYLDQAYGTSTKYQARLYMRNATSIKQTRLQFIGGP